MKAFFHEKMKGDFYLRPYKPGDENDIVELLNLVFDGWPKIDLSCSPEDHWRWKFLDNPFSSNIVILALSGGEIIGVDHSIPVRIKIGEQFLLINYTADLAVHPNFRKKGIAKSLIGESDKIRKKIGAQCLYFVTRRPFVIKDYSKPFPLTVSNLVRIQDINRQIEAIPVENPFFMKIGFQTVTIFNRIQNIFRRPFYFEKDLHIIEVEKFDEKIDDFFNVVSAQYNFIVERSHRYLNWRYCDDRAGDYSIKMVEFNGKILGYCVLIINRYLKNYPVGFIVDLLTLPERYDVADKLIYEAIHYFDKEKVNIINCLIVKNHPYEEILKRYGFLDSRIKFNLITNLDFMGKGEILRKNLPKKTHFTYGDIFSLPISMPIYR